MDIRPFVRTLTGALLAIAVTGLAARAQTTRGVSVAMNGASANKASATAAISADGRYVAFVSEADNLVPGDTNAKPDAFLRDALLGTTVRVSVSSEGTQANSYSSYPAVSADGRYVAYYSDASNLVAGDTNAFDDVFVRDTLLETTTRVSVASDGSPANGDSYDCSISADGRYIAFQSLASNLVSGDVNALSDIFLRDTSTGTTRTVSAGLDGAPANGFSLVPSISADGRHVAFASEADNLVPGDVNRQPDIFVRDVRAQSTSRASVASGGGQANSFSSFPSISASGRFVAFASDANNLVAEDLNGKPDIFVRDVVMGTTTLASVTSDGAQANEESALPSISGEGRFVAFRSAADNLAPDDSNGSLDVFVRDTLAGVTKRHSVATDGTQGAYNSYAPRISADGRYVAFDSDADNLTANDSNAKADIFIRGPLDPVFPLLAASASGPVRSSPTAVEGIVYFGDDSGTLHAVDAVDGAPVAGFPVSVSARIGAQVRIQSRPAVYSADAGAFIYLTTSRGDVCRVAMDGSSVLHYSDFLGAGNAGAPAVTPDGSIYAGISTDGFSLVTRLNADTTPNVVGPRLAGPNSTISSVAVAAGKVYVAMTNGIDGDIMVLNAADLTPLSSGVASGEGVTAPPYVVGDDMYVGTLAGNFYKLNSANNNVDITFGDGGKVAVGEPLPGSAFFSGGAFYAGTGKGKVWRIGLDGSLFKTFDTWNPSATIDGVVVDRRSRTLAFGSGAGGFYKTPLTGGAAQVFGPIPGFAGTPTVDVSTGRIFIGGLDDRLYAF